MEISPYCLGMVRSAESVPAAFDAGINFFFFSSDLHWPLYEETRQGLRMLLDRGGDIRQRIVIGVACYLTQPEFCTPPFAEVLGALPAIQHIDVAIAGGVYAHDFMGRLAVYSKHLRESFLGVRALGASFHDRQAALLAANANLVDIAFVRYNPVHPGARRDLFPHLDLSSPTLLFNFKSTIGAISSEKMKRLGLGDSYWRPVVPDYYRFALSASGLDGILCGLTPAEIEALAASIEAGSLTEEESNYLIDLADVTLGKAQLDHDAEPATAEPGKENHLFGTGGKVAQ